MSFTICRSGDMFNLGWNVVAKVPKAAWTDAAKGDLVIIDTSAANAVDEITTNENPYGIVVSTNSGNGVLSIAEFVSGTYIELPYTGVVALGDKIEFGSATHGTSLDRTTVQTDNSNGVGTVVAVDADSPHGTGHCVVRFS